MFWFLLLKEILIKKQINITLSCMSILFHFYIKFLMTLNKYQNRLLKK